MLDILQFIYSALPKLVHPTMMLLQMLLIHCVSLWNLFQEEVDFKIIMHFLLYTRKFYITCIQRSGHCSELQCTSDRSDRLADTIINMIQLKAPCQKTNYIFSLTIRETKYPSTDAQYTRLQSICLWREIITITSLISCLPPSRVCAKLPSPHSLHLMSVQIMCKIYKLHTH